MYCVDQITAGILYGNAVNGTVFHNLTFLYRWFLQKEIAKGKFVFLLTSSI